jgi:mannose-1-phosphate guanylyltransferase
METMDHYYAVIMAGGGGTRLWPLSRQARPKQSLKLVGDRSMFQIAVDRLAPLFPAERILVATSARYAEDLRQQCPALPEANFILEPGPRGTAPAIGLAAGDLVRRDAQAVMACLTADHFIGNEARFRSVLAAAAEVAQAGYLVTLGIRPTFASTGFGYIQRGDRLGVYGGFEAFRAERFKEKPGRAQAEAMVNDGLHSWNSGMFVWRAERFLSEVERQLPALSAVLGQVRAAPDRLAQAWPACPDVTVDYGIMEGARQVAVIPGDDLAWNDIGSWEALFDVLPADANGTVVIGAEHLDLDSRGLLIHASPRGARPRLVATIGLSEVVIVDTDDVLLVCPRQRAQEVRKLVERLKQSEDGKTYL